jgi:hypothetical protein
MIALTNAGSATRAIAPSGRQQQRELSSQLDRVELWHAHPNGKAHFALVEARRAKQKTRSNEWRFGGGEAIEGLATVPE